MAARGQLDFESKCLDRRAAAELREGVGRRLL